MMEWGSDILAYIFARSALDLSHGARELAPRLQEVRGLND